MKSTRPLVVALAASILAANSLLTADAADKKAATPAAKAKPAAPAEPAAPTAPAPDLAPPAGPAFTLPDVVATVEGADIKKEELVKIFDNYVASQQIPVDQLPPAEKLRGYRMLLDEMVNEKLIEKRAADVKISDDEVTATFKKFTANIGSEEEIKKQIEASGQTIEKLRENIRISLQENHWIDQELEKKGGVTDKDAEDFYKKNPEKFVSPEEVRASHILVKVEADAKPEVVAEKEKAAKAIAARVKKGEDFGKVAMELSEDPSAKQNSGDLDFFKKDQMVPEFSEAAFGMKKGDISDPVRSSFGFHIIKVTDRKDAGSVPLDTVKPKLITFLKQQKAEGLKQEIREKAVVKINLPEPPPLTVPDGAMPPAP